MLVPRPGRHLAFLALILIVCCGISGCGMQAQASSQAAAPASVPKSRQDQQMTPLPVTTPIVQPERLVIPAISVDANVENVGILPSGDLETPTKNPWVDTGWYDEGPQPGQQGSSVIDGHLDRPGGYPAVFWLLRNLHVGNEIEVVFSNNSTLHFRVTDVEYYPPQDAPLQEIFGNSNGKFLNLITCAGDWIPSQGQTTLRLVVYTTLM